MSHAKGMSGNGIDGRELDRLDEGQRLIYGGNRVAIVSAELAGRFTVGDRVLVDSLSGEILHIPAAISALVSDSVGSAAAAFARLAECTDAQITTFFNAFADRLADDDVFAAIAAANADDVAEARRRGRSVTRLILDDRMRVAMVEGLRSWADLDLTRDQQIDVWVHDGWSVSSRRAPLGVVGFVFEGRPNVFGDAAGVLRTGNTAVFRIGSDALATAEAIMAHGVQPAMQESGLPDGALELVRSSERSAGWALFSDRRLGLAVARGSGTAVGQLGDVARQSGLACSLHGTGGAWVIVDPSASPDRVRSVVATSLDRKVCNTLNTVILMSSCPDESVEAVFDGLADAADVLGTSGRVHLTPSARDRIAPVIGDRLDVDVTIVRAEGAVVERFAAPIDDKDLGVEWEWEGSPEISIGVVESLEEAVAAFNDTSPRFVVSLLSDDDETLERGFRLLDAPFVGDGTTRWVDGQFALNTPELGLSNWEHGRILGRGGILSGDGIFTVRYRSRIPGELRR